jgi:predicted 2-oxoglutarate/Fe(II)-dependent dioxygenase YbiX
MEYRYIKNFLNPDLCEKIINKYNNDSLLKYASTSDVDENERLDYTFNKRKVNFFNDSGCDYLSEVTQKVSNYIETEMKKVKLLEKKMVYTFNKYIDGDFLNYHSDLGEIKSGAIYTFVIELNEDYDGGEFMYKNRNDVEVVNEKSVGGLFIFDSHILHKVNPVISGTRFSLNCWPKFHKKNTLI